MQPNKNQKKNMIKPTDMQNRYIKIGYISENSFWRKQKLYKEKLTLKVIRIQIRIKPK